jgi:hypothetical protein
VTFFRAVGDLQQGLGIMMRLTLLTTIAAAAAQGQEDILNEHVLIDMTQNNPGDAVAWQQSKYFDPRVLKAAGYTGQTSTCEVSGTQAIDYHSTGLDFFPAGKIYYDS